MLSENLFTNAKKYDRIYLSNKFDKSAQRKYDAHDFSIDPRLHKPRGRILVINIEFNF